jgi:hypothetical protein
MGNIDGHLPRDFLSIFVNRIGESPKYRRSAKIVDDCLPGFLVGKMEVSIDQIRSPEYVNCSGSPSTNWSILKFNVFCQLSKIIQRT